jgi:glycosyltransferase involved in cell wall biosynthesis
VAEAGVVVIGRNEGERLRTCLQSLDSSAHPIVYVDSGSTDGSVALARSLNVEVVELDLTIPFTAARARNAGFERLLQIAPDIRFVQFVDGDCEIHPEWLAQGAEALGADEKLGVVFGRLRERHPDRSVYNRLCDIEWDVPVGERKASGGNALMRVEAVRRVGAFNPNVLAAEDDEICLRIRREGWRIERIDAEMGLHDAAMMRFGQWWKRAVRAGFAYAQGAELHGRSPDRHFIAERRRVVFWGFVLPIFLLALAWPTNGWSLLGFLLYPLQVLRVILRNRKRPVSSRAVLAYSMACVFGKFPEFLGVCRFYRRRRAPVQLIEYK